MYDNAKELIIDFVPPMAIKIARKLKSIIKYNIYPHKDIIFKNSELYNTGKGKRAFLLATGPSLKSENLKLLSGEDCFSISNFFLHEDISYIKPKFHLFAPYHEPLILENYVQWLKAADDLLPSNTKIILGHKTKEIKEKYNIFPNRDVYYLYLDSSYFPRKIDLTGIVLQPQSGPLMVIPVLIYMGYSKIYLLGCDHTVLRDYKKDIKHFYQNEKDIRKNASDKNSWEDIISSHDSSKNVFIQYKYYKSIIDSYGKTEIVNLSKDTWLDIFKIDSLDNII